MMDTKYGFYDRLTKEFPSQINVDLIEACNYACIHCPYSTLAKEKKLTQARLSPELNQKMVDEVRQYGSGKTQQIRYTANGEPFLHPEIMDILEYSVKNSGVFVSVTTNGSLVDEQKAQQLLEMGLGLIDFSLDAYSEKTYQEIRLHGQLEKVRNHILFMLRKKQEGNYKTRIVVSFVVQEKNEQEKEDFKRYWTEQGIDYVIFRKLHSAGGKMFHTEEREHVQPCVYPWERISLDANGRLQFCPNSWGADLDFEYDYRDHTIHEFWNSEVYANLRKEHLQGQFETFRHCATCPDRAATIWPADRTGAWRGYGDMISDFTKEDEQ